MKVIILAIPIWLLPLECFAQEVQSPAEPFGRWKCTEVDFAKCIKKFPWDPGSGSTGVNGYRIDPDGTILKKMDEQFEVREWGGNRRLIAPEGGS